MKRSNICLLLVLIIAVVVIVYGFMDLLKEQQPSERDGQTISRQLRGIGLLILAPILVILGRALCGGVFNQCTLDRIVGTV
jgi:uncharacterized membrane protein